MPDPFVQNGTAAPPVEPAPDRADTVAEDRPGEEAAASPLVNLGSDAAAVCADGVCVR
jgi:hypothetical protein